MQTEDARAGRRPSVLPDAKALRIGLGDLGLKPRTPGQRKGPVAYVQVPWLLGSVSADVNGDAL